MIACEEYQQHCICISGCLPSSYKPSIVHSCISDVFSRRLAFRSYLTIPEYFEQLHIYLLCCAVPALQLALTSDCRVMYFLVVI